MNTQDTNLICTKTLNEFLETIKNKKAFLLFSSIFCPPCKILLKTLESFLQDNDKALPKNLLFVKAPSEDISKEEMNKTFQKFNITAIPTIHIVDTSGKILQQHVGNIPLDQLKNMILTVN